MSTIPGGWIETQSSNWFLQVIEVHWFGLTHINLALFASWIALFALLDPLVNIVVAVSRGTTVSELMQPQNFKKTFAVKFPGSGGSGHGCKSARCGHNHGEDQHMDRDYANQTEGK